MPTNYLDCETCGHLLDLHISKGGKMMCEQCDCDKKIVYVSQEERQRLTGIRARYYSLPTIKHLFISNINLNPEKKIKRELAFLTKPFFRPKRVLRFCPAWNMDLLEQNFDAIDIMNSPFTNLYEGLAHLVKIPFATFHLKKRTENEDYEEFNENFDSYIAGYDILFDMDTNMEEGIETIDDVYKQAKILKELLEEKKIPFFCKFSGTKGLHFKIPFELIAWDGITDFTAFIEDVHNFIHNIYWGKDLHSIDLTVADNKQIAKLPYSLDRDRVALPLTDEQFDNFRIEDMQYEKVIKNIPLFNRGNLVKTYGLSQKELSKNFKKFFDEYRVV